MAECIRRLRKRFRLLLSVREVDPEDESGDDDYEYDVVVFFPVSVGLGAVALRMRGVVADGKFVTLLYFRVGHETSLIRLAVDAVGAFDCVERGVSQIFGVAHTVVFAHLNFGRGFGPVAVTELAEQLMEHGEILR